MKNGHSKKSLILVSALMLSAAALYIGCSGPIGMVGDSRLKNLNDGLPGKGLLAV